MLLGSWVLNSPVAEEAEDNAPPSAAAQSPTFLLPQAGRSGESGGGVRSSQVYRERRPMTRDEMQRATQEQRMRMQRTGQSSSTDAIQPGMAPRVLPTAPTELVPPGTPGMPLMPPTPTPGEAAVPAGQPANADPNASSRLPNAPTYRPPTASGPRSSSYSSYAALDQQRQLAGTTAYRSFASLPPPEKVYAGTQVSTSGVSPYLQLFRNDTAGGTIDNYSTLVKPQLQQQRMNQQFGTDLWGLQRDARIQQASVQRMQNNVRTLQGVGTPQFYMNGGGYYPDYGNSGYGNLPYGSSPYGNPGYGNPGYGP